MRVYICSDIHSNYPKFLPRTKPDLNLISGDITNVGIRDMVDFKKAFAWLNFLAEIAPTYFVPGNHDIGMDQSEFTDIFNCQAVNVLEQVVKFQNYTITGANLSTCYDKPQMAERWVGMTARPEVAEAYYQSLPAADIVLSHSPPDGELGICPNQNKDFGSAEFRSYIERTQPELVICGHIHQKESKEEKIGKTWVINVATHSKVIEL